MAVINTNVKALFTQNALKVSGREQSVAMQQLSTGKRINSARDDAAGLAISKQMTQQIRSMNMAIRNAGDAVSLIQTAEGATGAITDMLQRMRELAVQAANATYVAADRVALQQEFSELQAEINRISDMTEWNGQKILDGTTGSAVYQIGANSSQTITVTFVDLAGMSGLSGAVASSLTVTGAGAISAMDDAIEAVDKYRSGMGAKINRLTHAADNLTNVSNNTSASRSRILDVEYAKASSELARTQIIQQAATAILAQANSSQQSVMKLLQ